MFAAVGMFIVIFFIGYAIHASCNSLRVIRVSILTKVVPEKERATVLATHALMKHIGALMGPLVWISIQTYRGSIPLLGGAVDLDRFSLHYTFALCALVLIVVVSPIMLNRIVPLAVSGRAGDPSSSGTDMGMGAVEGGQEVTLHYQNGREEVVNLQQYKNKDFRYFCGIIFGVHMSDGLFLTSFQPILVNVFHTSDVKLGLVFEMIAVVAVIPPLLVALLPRYLMDRKILVIGLISKLIGMTLFLPWFREVREWQVITGFLLIIKASIFFSTASMSLFTKLLGAMGTSSLIGLLASGSNVGPTVAQIALSDHVEKLFGSFRFGLFVIPAILSLALIMQPTRWARLDLQREFSQLLLVELRHRGAGA